MKNFVATERDGQYFAPDGRRVYPFRCCCCGHKMMAAPSIFMHMGMNHGGGGCSNCDTYLSLQMVPDLEGDEMRSTVRPESYDPFHRYDWESGGQ